MSPVALRIANDVSYLRRINDNDNDESHFSWQVQYLVMLDGESCCSAHCTGRFM